MLAFMLGRYLHPLINRNIHKIRTTINIFLNNNIVIIIYLLNNNKFIE